MADNSESVKKDVKDRTLGGKFYADSPFSTDTIDFSGSFTTASESYQLITGMTDTRFYEKETIAFIAITATAGITPALDGEIANIALFVDSVEQEPTLISTDFGESEVVAGSFLNTLTAGSHTLEVKLKSTDSGHTANVSSVSMVLILLGT